MTHLLDTHRDPHFTAIPASMLKQEMLPPR
jgi:hypothetical protein